MNTIYILGNGFDLAHGIPSKYKDFKIFLETKQEYKELLQSLETLYGNSNIDLWSDFEYALGHPNINKVNDFRKLKGAFGYDNSFCTSVFLDKLKEAFYKWIDDINSKIDDNELFNFGNMNNDLFLSFNYTSTLISKYKVKYQKIDYIHGEARTIKYFDDGTLIFGHSGEKIYLPRDVEDKDKELIKDIYTSTNKDVESCIKKSETFKTLNNYMSTYLYKKVVIYGVSYSLVDLPYFKKLRELTSMNTKWFLFYYSEEDRVKASIFANEIGIQPIYKCCKDSNDFSLISEEE